MRYPLLRRDEARKRRNKGTRVWERKGNRARKNVEGVLRDARLVSERKTAMWWLRRGVGMWRKKGRAYSPSSRLLGARVAKRVPRRSSGCQDREKKRERERQREREGGREGDADVKIEGEKEKGWKRSRGTAWRRYGRRDAAPLLLSAQHPGVARLHFNPLFSHSLDISIGCSHSSSLFLPLSFSLASFLSFSPSSSSSSSSLLFHCIHSSQHYKSEQYYFSTRTNPYESIIIC